MYRDIYAYIYIYIYIPSDNEAAVSASVTWRHAARGATWGLEYLDIIRDVWASELSSKVYYDPNRLHGRASS